MRETVYGRVLYRGALVGIVALPVVVVGYALARYGPLLLDDGYYYLNIARHLAQGDGFTFDGLHRTNGFHLLWQLLLVPLFWVMPDRTWVVYAASVAQMGLFVGGGIVLYFAARRLVQRPAYALLAPALWLFNLWAWNKGAVSGMETALLLLCYGMALLALARLAAGEGSATAVGIWLLLATAARLDMLALAVSMGIVLVAVGRARQAFVVCAPALIYTVLYGVWSTALFGYPVPVSGYVKSGVGRWLLGALLEDGNLGFFSHAWRNFSEMFTLRHALPWPVAAAGMVGVAAPGLWLWRQTAKQDQDRARALRVVAAAHALYMVVLIAYYSAMYGDLVAIYPYYWLPSIYGVMLLAVVVVAALPWVWLRRAVAGLLVAGICGVSIVYAGDLLNTYHFTVAPADRPETHAAQYMNRDLPPDAVVGSWDAGYLGYYTDRPVVNLDGRVNSFEFVHYIENDRLVDYLDDVGIDYLANTGDRRYRITLIEETLGWEKIFQADAPPVLRSTRFHFLHSALGNPQVYRRSVYVYRRPAER